MNPSSKPKQQQRNITPNFLKFKRKPKGGKSDDQGLEAQHGERSGSKTSRCSFQVCEKRVLDLSKMKKNMNAKKQGSVQPIRKRREGLQVTSRRTSQTKREESEQQPRSGPLTLLKKTQNNISGKAIKLGATSRQKNRSTAKRTAESLQKQEERARLQLQNKDLINKMVQQQIVPNYMDRIRLKKREARQKTERNTRVMRKFLNVDVEMKDQDELKNYQIYAELGKGAYGVVKMGLAKRNNEKVAIKIYEKRRLDEPNKIKNLEREINILSKLKHPVIARLIDVIESSSEIYLIQEYGGANSLYNYLLSKREHRLQEQQARQFFKTLAQTIKYLHDRDIVHRDIKAENILLNRNKELKLIDFGFSIESTPPANIDTFCGTPTYMAPQIVSKKDHVPCYTDLWSLGGNYPFRAKNENDLFEKIRKGNFDYIHKDISQRSKHVIERLIRVDPHQRMSTAQMTESFWQWFLGESTKVSMVETTYVTNTTQ